MIAKSGLISDGFDTGLFIMSVEAGMKVAEKEGLDVLFIDEAMKATASNGMGPRLEIAWSSLEIAQARARTEKRPVFLELTAGWCEPCRLLEATTLRAPAVAESGLGILFARMDLGANPDAKLPYEAKNLPAMLLLDHLGRPLARLEGMIGPEDLALFLRRAAVGYTEYARDPATQRHYLATLKDPREPEVH